MKLAGAVIAAALIAPAAASADTFCVKHSGCTAPNTFTTITDALTAAQNNGISVDTIDIGPGTFDETPTDLSGNPVHVVGSGDSTNLAPSGSGGGRQVLTINDAGTTVSALKITIPAGSGNDGLVVSQTIGPHGPGFSHVDIVENASSTNAVGAQVYGSRFSDGTVNLPDSSSVGARLTDSSLVSSSVTADQSVVLATTSATTSCAILRSKVTGGTFGVFSDGSTSTLLADDLFQVSSISGTGVFLGASSTQTMTMDNDTLVGPGSGGTGAQTGQALPFTSTLTLNVKDTIIRGFSTDLDASGSSQQVAKINVSYSDFDPAKEVKGSGNSTITPGPGNLNVDPKFAFGFSLEPGSPVIDKGDPAAPTAGEPTTDLGGLPRKLDGDHNGTATVDMGAFEFAPPNRAPIASFTTPKRAIKGESVHFNGSASHDPDHDPISFAWRFGDGGTSKASKPSHTYAKPGIYHVQLTVTDDFGAHGVLTKKIVIAKPVVCTVPKLVGKKLSAAKRGLKKAHCAVGKITHRHSKHTGKGRVISSKPRAGTKHKAGTKVALVVSKGR